MRPNRILSLLILAALVSYFPGLALAAGDGAKVFMESCSPCHSAKTRPLDNMHLTKEQWKEAVDRMLEEGAEVPRGKMSELLDYLANTRGPSAGPADTGKK